ncbi:MAG: hypothetical protein IJY23_01175 [Clostridia bacterium]|nr:hypothetical protein [Clostridia bacterium]
MKMTEKLYYKDAYLKEFTALVISCDLTDVGYDIVLDKTAFFPEEGGQYSDKGYIEESEVFDVREVDEIIHHYAKKAVNVNESVHCSIDFDERFDKMQQHTAEHMISGFFHKLYGIENTGFHLGAVDVTLDTSKPVTAEQLAYVEGLVNIAVTRNIKIETLFPKSEELSALEYRSKLDLTENVRIVNIGDVDSCACCAPHVSFTGEVGMVKFVDAVKHKGGSRIRMLAGKRAYEYVAKIMREAAGVSVLLSSPQSEISGEVKKLLEAKLELEYSLKQKGIAMAEMQAEAIAESDSDVVVYNPAFDMDAMRAFVNKASSKIGGTIVALSGEDGAYKYILYSKSDDFQGIVKEANSALSGRGGGRAPMASGTFSKTLSEIENYFKK